MCTDEGGAARLEAVLVALVERKARALHAEQARKRSRLHPLLLLLRDAGHEGILHMNGKLYVIKFCQEKLIPNGIILLGYAKQNNSLNL